jgi:hypothetical protein
VWNESKEGTKVASDLEKGMAENKDESSVIFDGIYSRPCYVQFYHCFMRATMMWWRDKAGLVSRLVTATVLALFFGLLYLDFTI